MTNVLSSQRLSGLRVPDVFTPRRANVNPLMYVRRPQLETSLIRSVDGTTHSILFGESGNGKSWLYKSVFEANDVAYRVVNCANVSRNASLAREICDALLPEETATKVGYSETKEAEANVFFSRGLLSHEGHYEIRRPDPVLAAFAAFRASAGTRRAVVVIENLELIFADAERMRELSDIVILLDDAKYAAFNVKLLIVGVPNGVLEYFARTNNMASVANRLEELPKVEGLDMGAVRQLVDRGFVEHLRFALSRRQIQEISMHTYYVTMGVAQRVHEYCEKLAYLVQDASGSYEPSLLGRADFGWLQTGMRQAYTVIEPFLNSRRTAIARKNQVIFCIGRLSYHQFDVAVVDEQIRIDFPATATEGNMGVGQILAELCGGDAPLLVRSPNTNEFRVADPRYTMCIRMMLRRNEETAAVEKLFFTQEAE